MILEQNIANLIVKEIHSLVDKDINIMDKSGMIIASSNPYRIGEEHWGATRVIQDDLPQLYVEYDENSVQDGLNFPLKIDDQIVGVIGITGKQSEIKQIGLIVKKMAEIMLEQRFFNKREEISHQAIQNFLEVFIAYRDWDYSVALKKQAADLNIDLSQRYILMLAEPCQSQSDSNDSEDEQGAEETWRKCIVHHLNDYDALILERKDEWVFFFTWENKPSFNTLCRQLNQELESKFQCELVYGISSVSAEHKAINSLYKEAKHALKVAKSSGKSWEIYDSVSLELLVSHLPEFAKKQYFASFFKDLEPEELKKYIRLLELYFEHEGSLQKISEELFIHVNTLQYRLKNLYRICGKDIRKSSETAYYLLALLIYKEQNPDETKEASSQ